MCVVNGRRSWRHGAWRRLCSRPPPPPPRCRPPPPSRRPPRCSRSWSSYRRAPTSATARAPSRRTTTTRPRTTSTSTSTTTVRVSVRRRDRLAVVTSVRCTNQRALRSAGPEGETAAERRLRRRRTRWMGSEHDKTFIPGLPTVLPSTLTKEQEDQYLREYHHHHTKKQPVSQKKYLF